MWTTERSQDSDWINNTDTPAAHRGRHGCPAAAREGRRLHGGQGSAAESWLHRDEKRCPHVNTANTCTAHADTHVHMERNEEAMRAILVVTSRIMHLF